MRERLPIGRLRAHKCGLGAVDLIKGEEAEPFYRCLECGEEEVFEKQSFPDWLADVDDVIEERIGLSRDDLPDWRYWDAWNKGVSPKEAADAVLASACEDLGFDFDDIFGGSR